MVLTSERGTVTMKRFLHDDYGATSIEYALIASLIFLVIVTSVTSIGTKLKPVFNTVAGNLH